jgi:hypothetical protein
VLHVLQPHGAERLGWPLTLAVVVCVFATLVGFDRDRVFYPTLRAVIATY